MKMLTVNDLIQIVPFHDRKKSEAIVNAFNDSCKSWEINTRLRQCAYLAQLAHESGSFRYMHEIWGPTETQKLYERDFSHAWPPTNEDPRNHKAYELGNDKKGDGEKYKGHGPLQTTGKRNHEAVGKVLKLDLINRPELLEIYDNGFQAAGYFWKTHGLNELADHGDFQLITKRINGGLNGYKDRLEFYNKALNTIKQ